MRGFRGKHRVTLNLLKMAAEQKIWVTRQLEWSAASLSFPAGATLLLHVALQLKGALHRVIGLTVPPFVLFFPSPLNTSLSLVRVGRAAERATGDLFSSSRSLGREMGVRWPHFLWHVHTWLVKYTEARRSLSATPDSSSVNSSQVLDRQLSSFYSGTSAIRRGLCFRIDADRCIKLLLAMQDNVVT